MFFVWVLKGWIAFLSLRLPLLRTVEMITRLYSHGNFLTRSLPAEGSAHPREMHTHTKKGKKKFLSEKKVSQGENVRKGNDTLSMHFTCDGFCRGIFSCEAGQLRGWRVHVLRDRRVALFVWTIITPPWRTVQFNHCPFVSRPACATAFVTPNVRPTGRPVQFTRCRARLAKQMTHLHIKGEVSWPNVTAFLPACCKNLNQNYLCPSTSWTLPT